MSFPIVPVRDASIEEWQRKAATVINGHTRAIQAAGATANRPAIGREIGQTYFDVTLGRPIWWNGAAWIKADGTVV